MEGMELNLIPSALGTLSANGLELAPGLAYEDWEALGGRLQHVHGAIHWWLGDWLNYGERAYGEMYGQAGKETGYAYQTLNADKYVADRVEFMRRRINLSWAHHREVAPLLEDEQDYWLREAEAEGWNRKELRAAIHDSKALTVPLPPGKYRILYADPPWQYLSDVLPIGYGAATHHYQTMSVEALCELGSRVTELAGPDSVLFLWATSPKLEVAFEVMRAWGFEYKTSFVWDKVEHNFGYYNSVRHELLLIGGRGKSTPDTGELIDSVIMIPRSEIHSQKPDEFRAMIDSLYTEGPRIELFARERAEGWDSWGNQLE